MVSASAIAGEVVTLVWVHVGIEVPSVITVNAPSDGRPGLLDGEHTFLVVALELLSRNRVKQDGLDAEERKGGRTWLRLGSTR